MSVLWNGLIHNKVFMSAVVAWFVAQTLKTIIYAVVNREWRLERLIGSGGMPSSHAATVMALVVSAIINYGTGSFEFAVSAILAIIVIHDASGVRLETGKQAEVLNKLISSLQHGDIFQDIKLKELIGHTPSQVFFGSILGALVSLMVN